MTYTLRYLQNRREEARNAHDTAAYVAFDMLIGHMTGMANEYACGAPFERIKVGVQRALLNDTVPA